MTKDWVPMNSYGGTFSIGAGLSGNFSLLDPSIHDAGEVMGRVEGKQEYFIHRIVGQWYTWLADATTTPNVWSRFRIWPGMWDETAGSVQTPGAINQGYAANARFWWERTLQVQPEPTNMLDTFSHPWWSFVDVHPRQKCDTNIIPVLSMYNGFDVTMRAVFWLRLLVTAY